MLDNLIETLKQYWLLVYQRQWENRELLTMAGAATGLLLISIVVRRLRKARSRRRNVRTAVSGQEITYDQRIKFFQQEIIKRDYAEARLEREVEYLSGENEELRAKLDEFETENQQLRCKVPPDEKSSGRETDVLKADVGKLRRQVEAGKEACELARQEICELTAACNQLQDTVSEITNTNEELRQEVEAGKTAFEHATEQIAELTAVNERMQDETGRTVESSGKETDELKAVNETLAHQVTEGNRAAGRSRQEIAILTAANSQLQEEINELRSDNERLRRELEEGKDDSEQPDQDTNGLTAARERRRLTAAGRQRTGNDETGNSHKAGASGLTWSVLERMVPLSDVGLKTKSPARQLKELAEEVVDLNVQMGGTETRDATKEAILQACDYLDADNAAMAVDALRKFVDSVQARQSDNDEILPRQEAEHLIAAAREIIDLLEAQ